MNYAELCARDVKDLRQLAAQYGIKTGPRSKAETIAKAIVEFVTNKPKQTEMKHPAEQPAPVEAVLNTEEQIRTAIARQLEKPGFTATFMPDDTVIFRCRGAEESIHMASILRVIKSKAESVSRGATALRGIKDDKLNPTANSGLVMMV